MLEPTRGEILEPFDNLYQSARRPIIVGRTHLCQCRRQFKLGRVGRRVHDIVKRDRKVLKDGIVRAFKAKAVNHVVEVLVPYSP
jgi:hypothetical protein